MKLGVNGIRISYRIDGPEGAPWVTLSNSLVTTHRMWDEQMTAFTERYRVLRYDQRGHGDTDVGSSPYSFELLADDVLGLLDALSIAQTHFVGLSMGGMTGMSIALRKPSALRSLVLCDTASHDPYRDPAIWQQRIDAIRGAGNMDLMVEVAAERFLTAETVQARPEWADEVRKMVRSTPLEGYIGCCVALSQFDLTDRLSEIVAPTRVVVGARDLSTPIEMAEAIHKGVSASELVVLDDAAHLSNVDQPEAFNDVVLSFLDRHQ